jgi:hypothetical protein
MLTGETVFIDNDPVLGPWSFTLGQMRKLRAGLVALAEEFEASDDLDQIRAAVNCREDIRTIDAYVTDALDSYNNRRHTEAT